MWPLIKLAVGQALRFARPIRTGPVQARRGRVLRSENDTLPIGGPHREAIDAGEEAETRRSVPVQILHPDVIPCGATHRKRQPLAIGRKARGPVNARRRMQRLGLACAVQPGDRRTLSLPSEVSESTGPRGRPAECKIPARSSVTADILQNGRRHAGQRQPAGIEGHGEQRALVQVDQVPAPARRSQVAGEEAPALHCLSLTGLERDNVDVRVVVVSKLGMRGE
jgi:hypothetical protein